MQTSSHVPYIDTSALPFPIKNPKDIEMWNWAIPDEVVSRHVLLFILAKNSALVNAIGFIKDNDNVGFIEDIDHMKSRIIDSLIH